METIRKYYNRLKVLWALATSDIHILYIHTPGSPVGVIYTNVANESDVIMLLANAVNEIHEQEDATDQLTRDLGIKRAKP